MFLLKGLAKEILMVKSCYFESQVDFWSIPEIFEKEVYRASDISDVTFRMGGILLALQALMSNKLFLPY